MTDKSITVLLPEALWEQIQAAHLDVQRITIEALENAVRRAPHERDLLGLAARVTVIAEPREPTPAELDEVVRQVRTELHHPFEDEPRSPKP